MENCTHVIVYGITLSMDGEGANLIAETNPDVICMDPRNPTARQGLIELNPKTIIFDRTKPHPELDLALLREQQGLLLVNIDPCSDEVLVLTGQRNRIVSARELAHLVSAQTPLSAVGEEYKRDDEGGTFEEKLQLLD